MDPLEFRRSLIRAFGNFHAWAYEASGGRWGGRLQGLPMVLLHLVGRKTGKPRRTPLLYMKDGLDVVVVASFYGSAKHPAWYRNLMVNTECDIRIDRRRYRVRARTATLEEREKLWPRLVDFYPDYAVYQARTDREIPVVILTTDKIYVHLIDGTNAWAPVNARHIRDDQYEILVDEMYNHSGDPTVIFEFYPGDTVKLGQNTFTDGSTGQVAKELVSPSTRPDRKYWEFMFLACFDRLPKHQNTVDKYRQEIERIRKERRTGQFFYASVLDTIDELDKLTRKKE